MIEYVDHGLLIVRTVRVFTHGLQLAARVRQAPLVARLARTSRADDHHTVTDLLM